MLTKEDLRMNRLVQVGTDLYQVSTVEENAFTATHVYPLQPRTTVRRLSYDLIIQEPSTRLLNAYEDAWGFEPGSTKR